MEFEMCRYIENFVEDVLYVRIWHYEWLIDCFFTGWNSEE